MTYVDGALLVGEDDAWASPASQIYVMRDGAKQLIAQLDRSMDAWSHLVTDEMIYVSTISETGWQRPEILLIDRVTFALVGKYTLPVMPAWHGAWWMAEGDDGEVLYRYSPLGELRKVSDLVFSPVL